MGRGTWVRGVLVALLVATPGFAKPRPHAPAKAKPAKHAAAEPTPAETPEAAPDESAPAPKPKAAGTKEVQKEAAKEKGSMAHVTAVEESSKDKGVKTYQFSAVEVEGRLKSPEIVYFLRRVRAEFEAGDLGHRSFLPELSDTRRSPSLR